MWGRLVVHGRPLGRCTQLHVIKPSGHKTFCKCSVARVDFQSSIMSGAICQTIRRVSSCGWGYCESRQRWLREMHWRRDWDGRRSETGGGKMGMATSEAGL